MESPKAADVAERERHSRERQALDDVDHGIPDVADHLLPLEVNAIDINLHHTSPHLPRIALYHVYMDFRNKETGPVPIDIPLPTLRIVSYP